MKRTIYIFLDIDGVLNSESAFIYNYQQFQKGLSQHINAVIDEQKLIIFEDLCNRIKRTCNLKIIISSSWRKSPKGMDIIKEKLSTINLEVSGKTEDLRIPRGYEIIIYCENNNILKEDIIILDDDSDMEYYSDRHIKTYFRDGLTYKDTERALELIGLNDQIWWKEII